jgi:hypothetical protein
MAKDKNLTGVEIDSVSLNFNIQCRDTNVAEGSPQGFSFGDSGSLNFTDEKELNKVLSEKPYLAEIVPLLIKFFAAAYDRDNVNAKKLKEGISNLLK